MSDSSYGDKEVYELTIPRAPVEVVWVSVQKLHADKLKTVCRAFGIAVRNLTKDERSLAFEDGVDVDLVFNPKSFAGDRWLSGLSSKVEKTTVNGGEELGVFSFCCDDCGWNKLEAIGQAECTVAVGNVDQTVEYCEIQNYKFIPDYFRCEGCGKPIEYSEACGAGTDEQINENAVVEVGDLLQVFLTGRRRVQHVIEAARKEWEQERKRKRSEEKSVVTADNLLSEKWSLVYYHDSDLHSPEPIVGNWTGSVVGDDSGKVVMDFTEKRESADFYDLYHNVKRIVFARNEQIDKRNENGKETTD